MKLNVIKIKFKQKAKPWLHYSAYIDATTSFERVWGTLISENSIQITINFDYLWLLIKKKPWF